jgi:DNA transposition AAA+ family ATPase
MTVVAINEKDSPMFAHISEPGLRERVVAAQQYARDKYNLHKTWDKTARALGLGISGSGLNAFVTGSYNANPHNIVLGIEQARTREEERAVSSFVPDFVETTIARTIRKAVRHTRARGQLGTLSGDSGLGKTTALKNICSGDPSIVYVPCNPTINSRLWPVLELILRRLVAPGSKIPSAPSICYNEICAHLEARPRMIVLDEAQLISKAEIFDTLRTLSDDTSTPILFSGNAVLREFGFLKGAQAAMFTQFTRRCAVIEHLRREKVTKSDVLLIAAQRLNHDVIDEAMDQLLAIARGPGALGKLHHTLQRAHEMAKGGEISIEQLLGAINDPVQAQMRGRQ